MGSSITSEIERLSQRRQALWAGASETAPTEAARLAVKIADLYEELRLERAQYGTGGRTRDQIHKQARVESELERLTT